MSTFVLVAFVHTASAVALLGSSVVGEPLVRAAVRRSARAGEVAALLKAGRPLSLISPVAAFVLLGSGIYLAWIGGLWAAGWVQIALVLWLVNCVVAIAVVRPAMDRVSAEAAGGLNAPMSARLEGLRWSGAWSWGGDLLAANDAAMLLVMVVRPGLPGSVLAVVASNVLVTGARLLVGRGGAAAPARGVASAD